MNSFNSFKTFEALYQEQPLFSVNPEKFNSYWAHTHPNDPNETLVQHTNLVLEYALRLIDVHRLDSVIDRLLQPMLQQASIDAPEEMGNRIKQLFLNALIYHDTGKINENFQVEKMKNPYFEPNSENGIETRHSALSAFIYISHHLNRILQDPKLAQEKQVILYTFVFLFATAILKHHSPYIEKEYPEYQELVQKLSPYLQKFEIDIDPNFLQGIFANPEEGVKNSLEFILGNSADLCFPVYLLVKLCFSLLTASDYYATSAFMLNLNIDDFGVISTERKNSLKTSFETTKDYNRSFFKNREDIKNYPKTDLMQCNPENMNILRMKLLDEVLKEIEENPEEKIFYLEAPTGSGKTNVSLAVAMELLKSNPELNKIYYVFPFTTLITQTAKTILTTLKITPNEMLQLHSRSGLSQKRSGENEDDVQRNYIDHLFLNYPITLLTHVRFFDILKTNQKDANYLVHRLANSIVIVDELQSYPPREWDKIAWFIHQYAQFLNIRFVVMSATLPKLDNLNVLQYPLKFHQLLKDKDYYFTNPNFKNRVTFDFSLLETKPNLDELADFVIDQCNAHALSHAGKVKGIIEFIFKKTASDFLKTVKERLTNQGYKVYLLSGTILEPRRRQIIDDIKASQERTEPEKILLVSTQVVEAGVDIDMDIGFKDQSIVDSDEQLAGRVNRNARPEPGKVFIFKLDSASKIYGSDLRYRISRDLISREEYQEILEKKDFDILYSKVCKQINAENSDEFVRGFDDYKALFKRLKLREIHYDFKIIDEQNVTVFVPLEIPKQAFSEEDMKFLSKSGLNTANGTVNGEDVWELYFRNFKMDNHNFIKKQTDLKRIHGIMSQFTFSLHVFSNLTKELLAFCDTSYYEKSKILFLSDWKGVYDFETGINDERFNEACIL
jgi:CRISPR-associated endonuclease/helicase Cas3